jgi:transposase
MIIVGCDYHPGFQQIACVDRETGDCGERRLQHREEAEKFHRDLAAQEMKVQVGMEARGQSKMLGNPRSGWTVPAVYFVPSH